MTEKSCFLEFSPIIKGIANRLRPGIQDREDLIAVGRLAAYEALKTFELGRGTLLQSYVYDRVYSKCRHYVRDSLHYGIRLPAGQMEKNRPYTPILNIDAIEATDHVSRLRSTDNTEEETLAAIAESKILNLFDGRKRYIVQTVLDGGTVSDAMRGLHLAPSGGYRAHLVRQIKRRLRYFYDEQATQPH